MADFDSAMMKDMAKLKNINEADELLRGMKESGKEEHKNEYSTFKEVEELRLMVEKQKYLLHAFWLMLKEHGATNEDLDKALNEAVLLSKRTDYKNVVSCPNCGKGELVLRNAKKGKNKGEDFYGCSNFPKCKTIISKEEFVKLK